MIKLKDIDAGDRRFKIILNSLGILLIALVVFLVLQLFWVSFPAFHKFGFRFFTESDWDPANEIFGAAAFIYGTLVSSFLAVLIAAPLCIGVALFVNEIAPKKIATVINYLVEMLAAIPSVIYGLWGVFVLLPFLRISAEPWLYKRLGFLPFFQGAPYGVSILAASLILSIMIAPTITSIAKEVFLAIPKNQREGALALGATKWEMIEIAVLKSSRSGLIGAVVLGLARALGETMAVTMVIGNRPEISLSLFSPAQTMASVIANEYAEASSDLHLSALAAVGFTLFLVSILIHITARIIVKRTAT